MNLELRHLRALIALSEADTFTTAAAGLDTTQPTLSRTIQQLEKITGARLLERTTREFRLTHDGITLANESRELLTKLDNRLSSIKQKNNPPLRLGWAWAGFGKHTVPLIQAWKDNSSYPVDLSRPADPMSALRLGHIDAALIRHSQPRKARSGGIYRVSTFHRKSCSRNRCR